MDLDPKKNKKNIQIQKIINRAICQKLKQETFYIQKHAPQRKICHNETNVTRVDVLIWEKIKWGQMQVVEGEWHPAVYNYVKFVLNHNALLDNYTNDCTKK